MALHNRVKGEYHLFIVLIILLAAMFVNEFTFAATFKYKNGLTLEARTYKEAAMLCYKKLTNDKYVSEQFNMTAIDICVNPETK